MTPSVNRTAWPKMVNQIYIAKNKNNNNLSNHCLGQLMTVMRESSVPQSGKLPKRRAMSADSGLSLHCLSPTAGQCTTSVWFTHNGYDPF